MKNPFKQAQNGESVDHLREREALAEEYARLLNRAGIADEFARCDELLDGWPDDNPAPFGTEVWRKAEKRLDADRRDAHRNCLRRVVFGVSDVALRREIISSARKSRDLRMESFQRDLWDAARRRNQTGKSGIGRTISAAAAGVLMVMLFWSSGGAMWGTAAGVFMVILATYDVAEQSRVARRALEEASAEVADLEQTIEEAVNLQIFASYEEITGEDGERPDKELDA